MKRLALGFVLAFAALILMVSPAIAWPVLSAADQEFLASLATPAPALAAQRLGLADAALCSASVDCGNGTSVSCSSSVSGSACSAMDRNCSNDVRGSVTCDGVKTKCPKCSCDELLAACTAQCRNCPITKFQCDPYICNCLICPNAS
jgi:hypothetical protein